MFTLLLPAGIVETVSFLNTTFVTTVKLEIIAKDSFTPPAVSNRTILNVHFSKTPSVSTTNIEAGTTSLGVTFDVSEFAYLKIVRYEVLVQEYTPEDPNCMLMFIKFNFITSFVTVYIDTNKRIQITT